MTRELLERMPEVVVSKLNQCRKDYNNMALNKDSVRSRNAGYVLGLRDAGLITERERQILFVYTTI